MSRTCSVTSQREKEGLHWGTIASMEVTPTAFAAHPSAHLLFTTHICTASRYFLLYGSYTMGDELNAAKEQLKQAPHQTVSKDAREIELQCKSCNRFIFHCCICGSFQEAKLFVSRLPSKLLCPGETREKGNHYSSAKRHVIDGTWTICIHCFSTQHDRSQMQQPD